MAFPTYVLAGPVLAVAMASACASPPEARRVDGAAPGEPTVSVARPPQVSASAAGPSSSAPAASAASVPELGGDPTDEGPSTAQACKPEILARRLDVPYRVVTSADGRAFVIDTRVKKTPGGVERRTRVLELGAAASSTRTVADLPFEARGGEVVGDALVLHDDANDRLVVLDTRSGKREDRPGPLRAIASRGGALYGLHNAATRSELSSVSLGAGASTRVLSTLAGKHSPHDGQLALSASSFYFYVHPHPDDVGVGSLKASLAKAPLAGGEGTLLGGVHIPTALAASSGAVFVGTLTTLLRIDAASGAVQRARTSGGAENIAADESAGAWTNADRGTVALWPHGGAPHIACEIPRAVGVALTARHVYFTAYGPDLIADGQAYAGRFAR